MAAGNRDPDQFLQPGEMNYARRPNRHLTFGNGIHTCIGAPLARMELRVLLDELVASGADYLFDGSPVLSPIRRFRFVSLPIKVEDAV